MALKTSWWCTWKFIRESKSYLTSEAPVLSILSSTGWISGQNVNFSSKCEMTQVFRMWIDSHLRSPRKIVYWISKTPKLKMISSKPNFFWVIHLFLPNFQFLPTGTKNQRLVILTVLLSHLHFNFTSRGFTRQQSANFQKTTERRFHFWPFLKKSGV